MNTKFLQYLQQKNISIYKLSNETGIPYTNLNKLKNGKQDINSCAAKDLYKLALYFQCNIEDMLNPISFLDNTQGVYRKVKYRWITKDGNNILQVQKNAEYIDIDSIKAQTNQKKYIIKQALTEAILDAYILHKEGEELLC